MVDHLITDARIVGPSRVRRGDIAIDGAEIVAVGADLSGEPSSVIDADGLSGEPSSIIDADGRVALPGMVDVHCHMHDPALFPEDIDFATQTASAVAGGVTTVVELPTQTPVTTVSAFREKREACERLAHVDFGLVVGNVRDADLDAAGLVGAGTAGFKTFTADPYCADDRTIVGLMDLVGDAGSTVRVHCETQGLMDHARAGIEGDAPELYPDSRPLEAELAAIDRMGWFAEYADCPLHVVHISSGKGAREGARFKARATTPITLETCPQYLAFSTADVPEKGPFLKVNPSLKSPTERERLWDAVQDGTIDLIASDHFPTHRENRERGWEDIWEPYAGLPTVESNLEFLVSEGVHTGRLSWPRLCELVCARPAREMGVYPQKGAIRAGTDADIVLFREEEWTVSAEQLAYNGGWTPYEGCEWSAVADTVIANGEIAARDHEVLSTPGDGAFLACDTRS